MRGQREAGLAQLHEGLAAVLATGQTLSQICLILLAEAVEHTGQGEEGLRLLADALTALEARARGDLLAETYRLQGELLLRQASPDAMRAAACFQQALVLARRQQAKSWELRATTSLSRLWQQQGKFNEARALLAPIYRWFTEGFDTANLQEAQALLEGWLVCLLIKESLVRRRCNDSHGGWTPPLRAPLCLPSGTPCFPWPIPATGVPLMPIHQSASSHG